MANPYAKQQALTQQVRAMLNKTGALERATAASKNYQKAPVATPARTQAPPTISKGKALLGGIKSAGKGIVESFKRGDFTESLTTTLSTLMSAPYVHKQMSARDTYINHKFAQLKKTTDPEKKKQILQVITRANQSKSDEERFLTEMTNLQMASLAVGTGVDIASALPIGMAARGGALAVKAGAKGAAKIAGKQLAKEAVESGGRVVLDKASAELAKKAAQQVTKKGLGVAFKQAGRSAVGIGTLGAVQQSLAGAGKGESAQEVARRAGYGFAGGAVIGAGASMAGSVLGKVGAKLMQGRAKAADDVARVAAEGKAKAAAAKQSGIDSEVSFLRKARSGELNARNLTKDQFKEAYSTQRSLEFARHDIADDLAKAKEVAAKYSKGLEKDSQRAIVARQQITDLSRELNDLTDDIVKVRKITGVRASQPIKRAAVSEARTMEFKQTARGEGTQLPVKVEKTGPMSKVKGFIEKMETDPPSIKVDEVMAQRRILDPSDEVSYKTHAELQTAEPGARIVTEAGETLANPSSFPKWLPEDLRSSNLIRKYYDAVAAGEMPTAKSGKLREFFAVVENHINEEAGIKTRFEADDFIRQPKKAAEQIPVDELSEGVVSSKIVGKTGGKDVEFSGKMQVKTENAPKSANTLKQQLDQEKVSGEHVAATVKSEQLTLPKGTEADLDRSAVEAAKAKIRAAKAGEVELEALHVSDTGEVLDGAHRLVANKELGAEGLAELPAVVTKGKTREMMVNELPAKLKEKRLAQDVQTAVVNEAKAMADGRPLSEVTHKDKRVFLQIAELIEEGNFPGANEVAKKYGITPKQLADDFRTAKSAAGRDLGELGSLGRRMDRMIQEERVRLSGQVRTLEKQVAKFERRGATAKAELARNELADTQRALIELPDVPQTIPSLWEVLSAWGQKLENVRRPLLTSQVKTAQRNIASQSVRFTTKIFEDVIVGLQRKLIGGETMKMSFADAWQDLSAIFRKFDKQNGFRIQKILETHPYAKNKLYGSPVAEITMGGRVTELLNSYNRVQEFFFRDGVFDAVFSAEMTRAGLPLDTPPANIPSEILERAADEALTITFANRPKNFQGKQILKFFSHPVMTALGNPFPRFHYNAMKFLWDFNPTGFISTGYKVAAAQRLGTTIPAEQIYRDVAKATVGTTFLGFGLAVRNSEYAGDKWYEVKTPGGNVVDMRAYAPFVQYLFLASVINEVTGMKKENLQGGDYLQALLSMNRIAGTGLVVFEFFQGKLDSDDFKDAVTQWAQQYVGGFTVPFRTLKDIVAYGDPEEAKIRDTREQGFFAKAQSNIPFASQSLPELPSVTEGKPLAQEHPLLGQLTGISVDSRTFLESEMIRHDVQTVDILPRTGNRDVDRRLTEATGKTVELLGNVMAKKMTSQEAQDELAARIGPEFARDKDIKALLIAAQVYPKAPDHEQKAFIKNSFSKVKSNIKERLFQSSTGEIVDIVMQEIQGLSPDEQREKLNSLRNSGLITKPVILEMQKRGFSVGK